MLKIRLQKTGRKNSPSFRVILTESKRGPKGKHIELLGFYNARLNQLKLDKEKIQLWISRGAKVSDTVHNLLVSNGVIKGPKKNKVGSPKKEISKESPALPESKPKETQKEETPKEEASKEETPKEENFQKEPLKEEVPKEEIFREALPKETEISSSIPEEIKQEKK